MSSPKKAKLSSDIEVEKDAVVEEKENGQEQQQIVVNKVDQKQTQEQLKEKVRVWWAPTEDEEKTGYGGAYWPAVVLSKQGSKSVEVLYDNGDTETVNVYDIFRQHPPVNFGQEEKRLEPGEFCEVFNESETDPCAWFGKIEKQNKRTYLVAYPFHDVGPELVKDEQMRRARVFNEDTDTWQVIRPLQDWKDGCVISPRELFLCKEDEVEKVLSEGKVVTIGDYESRARELKIPRQAQMKYKRQKKIVLPYHLQNTQDGDRKKVIVQGTSVQQLDAGLKPIMCQNMQPGKGQQVVYFQEAATQTQTQTVPEIKPIWVNPQIKTNSAGESLS